MLCTKYTPTPFPIIVKIVKLGYVGPVVYSCIVYQLIKIMLTK